jgi:hypothetical protein
MNELEKERKHMSIGEGDECFSSSIYLKINNRI